MHELGKRIHKKVVKRIGRTNLIKISDENQIKSF
jgi:hypothetical protein